MAARLAAENITDRQITTLEANVEEQRKLLAKNDVKGYYELALSFHEQIARLAQNRTLEHLLASILAQIRAMGTQHNYTPTHLPQSCDDHGKLIKALRERNPDHAEREARTHMRDLFEEIRRTLQAQPSIAVPRKKTSV
jgi:DNA-binding GntR family transcriptional regulator